MKKFAAILVFCCWVLCFCRVSNGDIVVLDDCEAKKAAGETLPADFNQDCIVDLFDFIIIADTWLWDYNPLDS